MAILGLALAITGQQADAARGDRGPVARPHQSRAAAPSLGSRPVASRPARPVSTARGGHAPRVTVMSGRDRGAFGRDRGVQASSRHGARVVRGSVSRGFAGRHDSRQHAGFGRSFSRAGYHSAMLRGPSNRFASMSACSTQRGRRVCGGTRAVAMRWSGGLAPAAGQQSSCPDGTMATMAVGHENVVRCVPM